MPGAQETTGEQESNKRHGGKGERVRRGMQRAEKSEHKSKGKAARVQQRDAGGRLGAELGACPALPSPEPQPGAECCRARACGASSTALGLISAALWQGDFGSLFGCAQCELSYHHWDLPVHLFR